MHNQVNESAVKYAAAQAAQASQEAAYAGAQMAQSSNCINKTRGVNPAQARGLQNLPSRLELIAAATGELAAKLEGAVDRLLGSEPKPDSGNGKICGVPNGLSAQCDNAADSITEQLGRVHAIVNRLTATI